MISTISGVSVRPTMPRMSYALKISRGRDLAAELREASIWAPLSHVSAQRSGGDHTHSRRAALLFAVSAEEIQDSPRQPGKVARKRPGDESDVPALRGLLERHRARHILGPGQRGGWKERIVLRVDDQRRHPY